MRYLRFKTFFLSVVTIVLAATPLHADLVLNAAGTAAGFTVTNFATGLASTFAPPFAQGPFGMTVVGNGAGGHTVLLEDFANATLYGFNDVNGQTPGSALFTRPFQSFAEGFATLNGVAYGGNGSQYGTLSNTGVFKPLSIPGLPGPDLGMAADSKTGELIASSNGGGLIAINPTTNTFRQIAPVFADGVSVSPDGQTVYAEVGGNIIGYDVHTGAVVFTGPTPGVAYAPDGTGVISSSNGLNGDIIVNDNFGNVYLIDPKADSITLIGSNTPNERGDFTSPDFTNGTLLMDFSDEVERLSCGPNCGIGGGPPPVPEPSSIILFGTVLLGLIAVTRRFEKQQ